VLTMPEELEGAPELPPELGCDELSQDNAKKLLLMYYQCFEGQGLYFLLRHKKPQAGRHKLLHIGLDYDTLDDHMREVIEIYSSVSGNCPKSKIPLANESTASVQAAFRLFVDMLVKGDIHKRTTINSIQHFI